MLLRLMMLSPVQTGPVLMIAVPSLHDVNLSIRWPGEGLLGKQPERRPDPFGARGENHSGEDSCIATEGLATHKSSRCKLSLWIRRVGVCHCANYELVLASAGLGLDGMGWTGTVGTVYIDGPFITHQNAFPESDV